MNRQLPRVTWTELFKVVQQLGFAQERGGIHLYLVHPDGRRVTLSVDIGEMPKAVLQSVLKDIGLSSEEFFKLLAQRNDKTKRAAKANEQ